MNPDQQPHKHQRAHMNSTIDEVPHQLNDNNKNSKPQPIPNSRPSRIPQRKNGDPFALASYGTSIHQTKAHPDMRIFFQNVKGLSHSTNGEDYRYVMQHLAELQVDICGMAETNTAWQHSFLRQELRSAIRASGIGIAKVIFGSPSHDIDNIPPTETFQAGGSITATLGPWTSAVFGPEISDITGLGRWSGIHIRGRHSNTLSIITGYRSCSGSKFTAPLGSTFHREYEHLRLNNAQKVHPNPRLQFLKDIEETIQTLTDKGHMILFMLDANGVLDKDFHFRAMVERLQLYDMHSTDPAPSTYIGSSDRRIDYMFGCRRTRDAMTKSGTLSYIEGPQSDHRGLYVDLDPQAILHHNAHDNTLQNPVLRPLKSGNPELVATYHKNMLRYYNHHNMVHRINHLHKHHSSMTDDAVRSALETWDRDQGRAMAHSEKQLRHRRGKNHWSPTLRNAGILCRYWRLRMKARHRQDYQHTCSRLLQIAQQHELTFVFPHFHDELSKDEIAQHLKTARTKYRETQQASQELRHKSYIELLIKYENDNNPSTQQESKRRAKIVKTTMRSEDVRANFKSIRLSVKQEPATQQGGLKSIMVPTFEATHHQVPPDKTYEHIATTPEAAIRWETILDQEEIERHLLEYNRQSFRAAAATPCGHGIIADAITFTATSQAARDFLHGIIPSEWHADNSLLREFLTSFIAPSETIQQKPISTRITTTDVTKGFKKWKESTATSPSGRHLGHYKALLQDDILLECFTKFLSIAMQRGISIRRWQEAVNVLIEKDPGVPKIHRLRIIHLFEADFNFILKLLWGSRLVRRARDMNLLNPGQYGSVPGRTAMELVMLNQLSNDICRTAKINIIRFDNDASACYDRILVHLGMMAARRCGMPENALHIHAGTLQNMRYRVKTTYGLSEHSYQGTSESPLYGTGQGSGASPAVWLTLVVILMNTLERLICDRITFHSPDSKDRHTRILDAFVDDTSLAFTDTEQPRTYEQMVRNLETAAQTWQRLLQYSGGALNLKKCSWSILYWEWHNGRPVLRQPRPQDAQIHIRHNKDDLHGTEIKMTTPCTANRILGVHLNPIGDFSTHLTYLRKKANAFATCIRSSRITVSQTLTFLKTIYAPSMMYSLPVVSSHEDDLASVQSDLVGATLQKLGASSKTPTEIRHGPYELGGLNILDLRTETGIASIKILRDAIWSDSEVGRLIKLSIKMTQIEAGIAKQILEAPCIPLPYITATWVTSIRDFLALHNIQLTITDSLTIRLNGPNDACIMNPDRLRTYTTQQQRDINLVRLHLRVITLSDMSTPDGQDIFPKMLNGEKEPSKEEVRFTKGWPRQHTPTASQRRLWQRYIRANYLRYGTKWQRSLGVVFAPHQRSTPQSDDLINVITNKPLANTVQATSLKQFIQTLPQWHKRMILHHRQIATDLQVWRAFRSRQRITIASDGGLKDRTATFGWKIAAKGAQTPEDIILFEGSGPVDGPFDISSSTRSELGGLVAPLLLCVSLAAHWGLRHKCKIGWLTDSKAAISRVEFITRRSNRKPKVPEDHDYMTAIRELSQALGRRIHSQWIKGHQDDRTPYEKLSREAKLNVDVDHLATMHQAGKKLLPKEATPHLQEQRVSVIINGQRYPSQVSAQIRFHINGSNLKHYLTNKWGWSEATWKKIDIHNFGTHFRRLTTEEKVQHMKYIHDLQAIGRRKGQISKTVDGPVTKCPCCRATAETQFHLLHCRQNPKREQSLKEFSSTVRRSCGTKFGRIFGAAFEQWFNDPTKPPSMDNIRDPHLDYDAINSVEYIQHVRTAFNHQNEIGWMNATRGFLARSWYLVACTQIEIPTDNGVQHSHREDGQQRIYKAVCALHKLVTSIWKGRNEELHRRDQEIEVRHKTAIDAEIARLHCAPNDLPAADQHYCHNSLDYILRKSPTYKRRWIHRVRAAITRNKAGRQNSQQRITTFFTSNPPRLACPAASTSLPPTASTHQRPIRTTQQLITEFFQERAPNRSTTHPLPTRPSPD